MTMKDRVKELRRVPASELRANPKNWRRHPPSQEAALRGVLEDIGFADAVIARETDDGLELIDGHLRQEVMGDQVVPVLIVDVTEEEADKMLLTYDPLAMMAHADQDQLLHLLRDTQFESKAVNDMLEAVANGERLPMPDLTEPVEDPGPQIDRADELREKWQTERGQVWEVGRHRLMCGDATGNASVVMNGAAAACIIADPPYGMRLDTDFSGMVNKLHFAQAKGVRSGRTYDATVGDDADFDARPVIAAYGNPSEQFWFGADYYSHTLETEHRGAWLVWDKRIDDAADKMFGSCFELIWSHRKCKRDILRIKWAGIFGTEHEPQRGRFHANQKPVGLLSAIIERTEGIIADPFLGSGTTMVAAEQLGRICYGMEIEPKYVAVALERMAGMGLEPKLAGG